MDPARPQVDEWARICSIGFWGEPLKRQWFFEQSGGNCRLMAPFTDQLSETARVWGRAVAFFAECVTRELWSSSAKLVREPSPPTRLTQRRKQEVKLHHHCHRRASRHG